MNVCTHAAYITGSSVMNFVFSSSTGVSQENEGSMVIGRTSSVSVNMKIIHSRTEK
jgi:hypothetical protein